MLSVTKPSANRLDIELDGVLTAAMMRAGLDALIAKSADITDGVMLYRIPAFAMPTVGALGVEIARLPKLFALIGKFEKCAVLTDSAWLRKAAELEGVLIPGLSIKSFDLSQIDAAEAWLSIQTTHRHAS